VDLVPREGGAPRKCDEEADLVMRVVGKDKVTHEANAAPADAHLGLVEDEHDRVKTFGVS
jgi:hypothetical protein